MVTSHARRWRTAGSFTAVVVSLSLAACSSSGKSNSGASSNSSSGSAGSSGAGSSSAGSTSSSTTSGTKAPIKILAYSDVVRAAPAPPLTFLRDISTATVKAINAAGGINGAPIEMTFCDSKLDPNATLACVKQATSGNYAAVIVPSSAAGAAGADALLAKAKIPIFYGIPVPGQTTAANAVCVTSTIRQAGLAVGTLAKHVGVKKLGRAHIEYPVYAEGAKDVADGLMHNGVSVGAEVTTPTTTTDMSSVFAQAMSGGADGIWYAASGPVLPASIKQFLQTYPGKPLIAQVLQPTTLSQVGAAADGHVYDPAWTQPISSGVPGAKEFVAAMKKYATDPAGDTTSTYIPFSLPFRLFAGIAATVKGNVDATSMLAAMKTASNVSLGGVVPNYDGAKWGKVGDACLYQTSIVPLVAKGGDLVTVYGPGKFLDATTNKLFSPTS